jgi:2-methylcitrate dehydratase PrpD
MALSVEIARHIVSASFEQLPGSTRRAAGMALMDGLGVMLGASGYPEARPFVELARAGTGSATVLGHGFRSSASAAAMANGAMAHVLDFEDAFDAAPCHPNASLLPAALAVAEAYGPVSGEKLLTAIAVGCDLVCRLGLALRRPMEEGGWYPPPILGAFGATAACAKLLDLNERQILDAFSLVLGQNSCPGEIKNSADTVIRAIREAFPAQAAVTSALLARSGVRGFDEPFEGKAGFYALFAVGQFDPLDILDGLGHHFWIDRLTYKKWPCCRGTHAFIEAVQIIRGRRAFDWRDIERIELSIGEVQRMLAYPENRKSRPATPIDAKFSAQFTTAVALLHDEVTLDSFSPWILADLDVLSLTGRVALVDRPDWGRDRGATGEVALEFRDGTSERELVEVAVGHPDRPLDEGGLLRKFIDCAGRAANPLDPVEAEALADRISKLASAEDAAAALIS